jgi:hypothetical protein
LIGQHTALEDCGDPGFFTVDNGSVAGVESALQGSVLIDVQRVEESQVDYQSADRSA